MFYRNHRIPLNSLSSSNRNLLAKALHSPTRSLARLHSSQSAQEKTTASNEHLWRIASLIFFGTGLPPKESPICSYLGSTDIVVKDTSTEAKRVVSHADVDQDKPEIADNISSPEKTVSEPLSEAVESVVESVSQPLSKEVDAASGALNEASKLVETTIESVKSTLDSVTEPIVNAYQEEIVSPKDGQAKLFYKYVLVGGGTATFSAMQAIKQREPEADVLIITEEPFTPYMRPPLSKELWFSKDKNVAENLTFSDWEGTERNLLYGDKETFEIIDPTTLLSSLSNKSPKIITGCPVKKLDVEGKVLHLDNGNRIAYGKLLLATGGTPKTLPFMEGLPKTIQSKVTTYRNLSDFKQLDGLVKQGKTVAVIGGGFLGSELAYALAKRAGESKVTQIFQEEGNMALVFPPYLTKWTTEKMKEGGVSVKPEKTVTKVQPSENDKVSITLNDGENFTVDHVIVAVGIAPNDRLAKEAGLEIDSQRGGVLVNAELESRGNIFVAGDVSSYHDIALGRRRVEHHDHAALSGRHAGENMVGPKKPYRHQSMFWSDLGPKIGYEAVGLVDSNLKTSAVWVKAEGQEGSDSPQRFDKGVVFYFKESRLVGVMLWNLFGKVDIARQLIRLNKFGSDDVKALAAQFKLYDSEDH